jgi:hypothetical protein
VRTDFFGAIGDVFSVHSVPNPDPVSERALLQSYGPHVPLEQIAQLVDAFSELRALVLEGTFNYPYSTRELVAIVRHLEFNPDDGLLQALDNVIDFDRFDAQALRNLKDVFARHGIPLLSKGQQSGVQVSLTEAQPLPAPRLVQTWSSTMAPPKRTGLSMNQTSASSTSTVAGGALASRFFSTASSALSSMRGLSSSAAASSSSSLPSVLTSAPLSGRSWSLHLEGQVRANESFENRRLDVFSEEKLSWKVSTSNAASAAL